MGHQSRLLFLVVIAMMISQSSSAQESEYYMPAEDALHEGTWLEWPHHHTYGYFYRNSIDPTWVDMTAAIVQSEKVHIVVYDETEHSRVIDLLYEGGVEMDSIDFYIHPFDDVWVRDNGPIFVLNDEGILHSLDWGFNGWGNDYPFSLDDPIPTLLAADIDVPSIDLAAMVLEGGAFEHDGGGTMMATKSSIAHDSRNPNLSLEEIEAYLTTYMGVSKFIWLEGVYGLEVTDMHIDGFVKFVDDHLIATMSSSDLIYWGVPEEDIDILNTATNINNDPYEFIFFPLTQNDVETTGGFDLGYKGSYINYYVTNSSVLVPHYNDPNDEVADEIFQELYPSKTIIGIDVRNLYSNGGMVHCVVQQQPFSASFNRVEVAITPAIQAVQSFPNPALDYTNLNFTLDRPSFVRLEVCNLMGERIWMMVESNLQSGENKMLINTQDWPSGTYTCRLTVNQSQAVYEKIIVIHE